MKFNKIANVRTWLLINNRIINPMIKNREDLLCVVDGEDVARTIKNIESMAELLDELISELEEKSDFVFKDNNLKEEVNICNKIEDFEIQFELKETGRYFNYVLENCNKLIPLILSTL